jgi:pimeloyl-ACP methyl ester carboxylesterase
MVAAHASDAAAMVTSLDAWRRSARPGVHRGHGYPVYAAGAGPVLVLIHGFPTAAWDWHHQWATLAAGRRVIAIDMLGFGFADKPRSYPYSVMDHADQHEAALAALGVTRYRILAHDYGDTVAQELLARDRERPAGERRIEAVTLLNGGLFPETHRATVLQRLLATRLGPLVARLTREPVFRSRLAAVFGAGTQPSTTDLDEAWALVEANGGTHRIAHLLIDYMAQRRAHRARWVGALVDAGVPVRLICGADDPVSGAHMAARYRELVPAPDVHMLAGIGHYPQLEAPGAIAPLVL